MVCPTAAIDTGRENGMKVLRFTWTAMVAKWYNTCLIIPRSRVGKTTYPNV